MDTTFTPSSLKIQKASHKDWNQIIEILKETRLANYMSGNESYKSFFVVRNHANSEIICCFAIEQENDIGILKSFAVKTIFQRHGIGKHVVNLVKDIANKLKIKRLYASSWEAPDFWRKTSFKEIKRQEIKDNYAICYITNLENRFPELLKKSLHFLFLI